MIDEVINVFRLGPMFSFWGARKLSSYLLKAKIYPLKRSVGSFKRCQACMNVTESNTFPRSIEKKEHVINQF